MGSHANASGANVHKPWRQEFPNAAARLADATDYDSNDIDKIAIQLDTKELYFLESIGPTTWALILGTGAPLADTFDDQTVQTTDATVTTIATYTTLANERAIKMKASVWGREPATDDTVRYVVEAIFNRDGAGVVTEKETDFTSIFEDQAAWDLTFVISGSDIQVRVTGEAAKTIEWRSQLEVSEHG